jgi:CubicO group peptidase (beta-lactamase class C family)
VSTLPLLAFQAVAKSEPPPATVSLPDTPVGRIGQALLRVLDSSDNAVIQKFVTSAFSDKALRESSAEDYLAFIARLRVQSGGLLPTKLVTNRPRFLEFEARSVKGDHWARVVLITSREHPDRLNDLVVMRLRNPQLKLPELPSGRVPEESLAPAIERHVQAVVDCDEFSGVVLVARGERVVVHRAYGFADQAFCVPNKPDTRFNLASMNKMFTSVAIAQLVQSGRLSFDDKLAKVLPDYPNKQVAGKVTIRQLLTHTGGLGDIFKPAFYEHRDRYRKPRDYFGLFADEPLEFEPGARWSYSNAGFVVLGAVIEKLSGQDYFDYIREHVYAPAGMRDSDSYEATQVVENLAVGYRRDPQEDPLGVDPRRTNIFFLPWKGSPAGGGYSTARDLLAFSQALRGHKLLNARLTEEITNGKVDFRSPAGPRKYAYGFVEQRIGGKDIRGHEGGGPGAGINAELEMFWDGSYTVVVLANFDSPAALALCDRICRFLAHQ